MLPSVQLDANHGKKMISVKGHDPLRIIPYLLIFANNSLIKRERLSLHFICFTWRFFKKFAITVFKGTEIIMMATPTNADHPRRLYNETNARVTFLFATLAELITLFTRCKGNIVRYLEWGRDSHETIRAQVLQPRGIN